MADPKPQYDADGDLVTPVILDLLNDFPALADGDEIAFATLGENRGKAMFPLNGAVIQSKIKDVLGNTEMTCVYPIVVIYRTGNLTAERRQAVKEWLDALGRWLEKQTIYLDVNDTPTAFTLDAYPSLGSDRRILSIQRTAPSYCDGVNENLTEDWAISVEVRYITNF